MKTKLLLLLMLCVSIFTFSQVTTFDFETATDYGSIVTQNKSGYSVNVESDTNVNNIQAWDFSSYLASPGSGKRCFNNAGTTGVTYTFNQPVDVVSIVMASDSNTTITSHIRFTFTPTGGSNPVKQATVWGNIQAGTANPETVTLNWSNITSFRITAEVWSSPSGADATFLADDLKIMPNNALSINDLFLQETFLAPNPCLDRVSVSSKLAIREIKLYNTLGQLVMKTNDTELNVEQLTSGLYIAKITTKAGTITKRIVKK